MPTCWARAGATGPPPWLGPSDYAAAEPRDIDGTSFVGLFVSRAAIARVGFPDGHLFLYGDDVLYTLGLHPRRRAHPFRSGAAVRA